MLMDARATGMTTFDFWGIAPTDDPSHPWHGLSTFKRSFGGQPLERLGTWEIGVRPGHHPACTAQPGPAPPMRLASAEELATWDDLVTANPDGGHILQTRA